MIKNCFLQKYLQLWIATFFHKMYIFLFNLKKFSQVEKSDSCQYIQTAQYRASCKQGAMPLLDSRYRAEGCCSTGVVQPQSWDQVSANNRFRIVPVLQILLRYWRSAKPVVNLHLGYSKSKIQFFSNNIWNAKKTKVRKIVPLNKIYKSCLRYFLRKSIFLFQKIRWKDRKAQVC